MLTSAEHISRLVELAAFRLRALTDRGLEPELDPLIEALHAACLALDQPPLHSLEQRVGELEREVAQVEQCLQLADEQREQSAMRRQAELEASLERLERELGTLADVASRAGWDAEEHGRLVDWLAARLAR